MYVYYSIVPRAVGATDIRIMWMLPNEVYNFITMSRKDSWRFKSLQNSKKSNYGKIRGVKVITTDRGSYSHSQWNSRAAFYQLMKTN